MKKLLSDFKIHHFSTENDDIKASIVERFNRTLQSRIFRYFTHTETNNWYDSLPEFTMSYNQKYHRSIGMAPKDVTRENSEDVWLNLYGNLAAPATSKIDLKLGDHVRISKYKHIFSKGYDNNWSTEIFIIDEVVKTNPVSFRLRDLMNESIFGTYYQQELQKVDMPKKFAIEKVLKQKKDGNRILYFVKYKGYPSKFNEWISKKQFS